MRCTLEETNTGVKKMAYPQHRDQIWIRDHRSQIRSNINNEILVSAQIDCPDRMASR